VFFANGKKHDFRAFKGSKTHIHPDTTAKLDTGYQGMKKFHKKSVLPHKRRKKKRLTKEEKRHNRRVAGERVVNEHAIGFLKRFRILSERYRNRRKRFGLRFSLICGLCNFDNDV